ncbi:MAG: hypothetical protein ACREDE_07170 [Thermoplasmata archaeon]
MGILTPDERLEPLLFVLEATIHRYYSANPRLSDADLLEVLHDLQRALRQGRLPEVDPGMAQTLARVLVEAPEDYDANDQAMALRFLIASVKRHRRVDGPRGYLDFIAHYTPLVE